MENAIPEFMQYGAMGILALGFVVLLVLYVRSDKRSQKYADRLEEASFDRSQLIEVVRDNTRAITTMTDQIGSLIAIQERSAGIMAKLNHRLDSETCPFLSGPENQKRRGALHPT